MSELYDRMRRNSLGAVEKVGDRLGRMFDNRSVEVLVSEELEKRLQPGKRTVLYIGIRYDYAKRDQGLSYEHHNFYQTIVNMDINYIYFDYDRLLLEHGRERMSEMLKEAVNYYRPDYLFYFHFKDWIAPEVLRDVAASAAGRSIIWLSDDHWRYEESRQVWQLFDLVVTTDAEGVEKRRKEGRENVLLSQWGCNHFLYKKLDLPKIYDVSFTGRTHGKRVEFIEELRRQGINVATFGEGWEGSGRITQSDLIRIFNQSRICLNISLAGKDDKLQIKGRDFEVPGCGSLLMTKNVSGIASYYVPGEEIAIYEDVADCARRIKELLADEKRIERMAAAGRRRALRDHTVEGRLEAIFSHVDGMKKA
jgi:spore maturation protein CgeB